MCACNKQDSVQVDSIHSSPALTLKSLLLHDEVNRHLKHNELTSLSVFIQIIMDMKLQDDKVSW